jgi:Chromatin associated protein KTI12
MTRWDSPLFTVPYEDETPDFEAIWDAMVGSDGRAKSIKPNAATIIVSDPLSRYIIWACIKSNYASYRRHQL